MLLWKEALWLQPLGISGLIGQIPSRPRGALSLMGRQLLPQGSPWADGADRTSPIGEDLQSDGATASTLVKVFNLSRETQSLPYRNP